MDKNIDLKQLCQFLVIAKKQTYAAGDKAKKITEKDKSTTITFEQGDWKYHDNYFGGEPFGGREVVFFQGQPVYLMTYYGNVHQSVTNLTEVYGALQKALSHIPKSKPFRGPKQFDDGDFSYTNTSTGEIDDFFGQEILSQGGKVIYVAKYLGGLVNQRN